MCHESSGSALTESIGIGKGTVTIEDFAKAQVIFLIGHNPATNHPRMLTTLAEAKQAGAKIIAVNPLVEAGLLRFKDPQEPKGVIGHGQKLTDIYLHVRINGDIALFKGIMKEMLALEDAKPGQRFDWDFIRAKTAGIDDFLAQLRQENIDELVARVGRAAREDARGRRAAGEIGTYHHGVVPGPDPAEHRRPGDPGTGEHQPAARRDGQAGRGRLPRARPFQCAGRPHDGRLGTAPRTVPRQAAEVFGFEPPRHHGFDVVESIKAMHAGKAKVFVGLCGNFLSAAPDTEYTAEAMRNTRLTVQISTKLNRGHLVTGKKALILPALGRTEIDMQKSGEQFQSTENSMGVVEMSRGRLKPASPHLMSEPAMICAISPRARWASKSKLDWLSLADNYDRIRDLIAKVIPGCDDYNEKVRQKYGFYLPNKPREGDFSDTRTGKANFTVVDLPSTRPRTRASWSLTTVRSHDQFNTTIYAWNDVYRGIHNERRVLMMNHGGHGVERGLVEGDIINITSHFKGQKRYAKRFIVVPYRLLRRRLRRLLPRAQRAAARSAAQPKRAINQPANTSSSLSKKQASRGFPSRRHGKIG